MKNLLPRILGWTAFMLIICLATFKSSTNSLNKKAEAQEREDGMLRAWNHEFKMTRDPQLNIVPVQRMLSAQRQLIDMQNARTSSPSATSSLTWQERGPNNVGGRTRGILVDRSDATGNTVFAAGVGGGLWKTTNFKTTCTWTVINDFFANIAITCIKQSPTNASELYFGTGEGWNNFDQIDGLGIWKSTDGGASWTQLSSTTSLSYVNDLEFDNNGYIYAATRSTVAGLRGIIRSTDGGSSWTQVLTDPIPTAVTRGADLERGANGDMYATLGVFSTGHIFRSAANGTNTGISGSWTNITPSTVITNKEQRIEVAICPSNSARLYALTQDSVNDGIKNLYRSDNSGGSWTTLTIPTWCDAGTGGSSDFTRNQAWYDLIAAVDPNNDQTVYIGGVDIMKTTNAGSTWSQVSQWSSGCASLPYVHADIHEIQYFGTSSTEMVVGCDGGVFYTTNAGTSFTNKNTGYDVTQYYGMAISATSGSNTMLAGAQDNGSHLFSSSGINTISSVTGGDGAFCFIDKTNSAVWITSNPSGYFNIYRNNGSTFVGSAGNGAGRFVTPADYADTINVLYGGDADGKYRQVKNVETGTASTAVVDVSTAMGASRQVSCVKIDPADETTIWLGCSDAEDNTGAAVTPILLKVIRADGSSSGPPSGRPSATAFAGPTLAAGSYISNIDIERGNSNHMLLTVSNYGVASIWESTDGGTNWSSLDNNGVNLPDMPVRWGLFIPSGYTARTESVGGIMIATELGVWTTTSINGTSTVWTANNSGLANVRTDQLVLRNADKVVGAATHGRGVYTTTLFSPPLPVTLLDFYGHLQSPNILLQWSTASEANSSYFELQKSYDGINFHKIAKLQAAGTSNSLRQYHYLDTEKPSSLNYYRLKMVDADGSSRFSDIVLIRNSSLQQNVYVLGTTVTTQVTVRFAKIPSGTVNIRLYDMGGKLLAAQDYSNLSQTVIQPSLNIPALSKGVYLMQVMTGGEKFTRRVVKE